MPNIITPTGLEVASQTELVTLFTTAYQTIYGSDINLDPDSPDGQMMMIFIQAILDVEDLLVQIYNQFDPDNAIGVVLDQRVAINGIQRQAGTFTITNITIVTTQALNLFGADQTAQDIYTVADNAGNKWQLQVSQNISGPGTYVFSFQSAVAGAVLTVPNTITIPVSIVLGVSSINNPTAYTTLGINEESDAALRIRRQKSVSLAGQGFLAGLLAALENLPGMGSVFVYENNTGVTDGDGVPGHSIWVITSGTALDSEIANAIYLKRNAGCGMFGSTTFGVVQADGSTFIIKWDVVLPETLFIKFTATSLDGLNMPNVELIRSKLVDLFTPGVNQEVNINGLATIVQQIDPNTLVTNAGFSTTSGGSYTPTLTPTTKQFQFAVTEPNIIIIPMLLLPSTAIVHTTATQTFAAQGGFGAYVYSISVNNSGGTINSSTGLYTAGAVTSVTDTILVTDAQSNTATASVGVIP